VRSEEIPYLFTPAAPFERRNEDENKDDGKNVGSDGAERKEGGDVLDERRHKSGIGYRVSGIGMSRKTFLFPSGDTRDPSL